MKKSLYDDVSNFLASFAGDCCKSESVGVILSDGVGLPIILLSWLY